MPDFDPRWSIQKYLVKKVTFFEGEQIYATAAADVDIPLLPSQGDDWSSKTASSKND